MNDEARLDFGVRDSQYDRQGTSFKQSETLPTWLMLMPHLRICGDQSSLRICGQWNDSPSPDVYSELVECTNHHKLATLAQI